MFLTMTKIEIVGPKHELENVLGHLHEAGVLDFEDLTHKFEADTHIRQMQLSDSERQAKDRLETDLVKINSFITALESSETRPIASQSQIERLEKSGDTSLLAQVDKVIDSIEEKTQELSTDKRELELEQTNLGKYIAMFVKMTPLAKQLVALKGFNNIMLLIDKKDIEVLDAIKDELAELTHDQFQLIAANIDNETTAVMIVFNHKFAKQVHGFLWNQHVNEVRLPEDLAELPYEQALAKMEKRREEIPRQLEGVLKKLNNLAVKYGDKLATLSQVITDRLAELYIMKHCGATDYTFVIQGWLPKRQLRVVSQALEDKFSKKISVEELPVSEDERHDAPIKYSNKFAIKAFEPVMSLFGAPKYGTVDATPFVAFFFPLFFGVILGDMGYALVLLALALWLRRRFKDNQAVVDLSIIVVLAGISSFIFGFMYGEFFGDLPERFHLVRPASLLGIHFPINRAEEIIGVLFMAIGLGALQILVGLGLGVINASRDHNIKHALEKGGMALALIGLIVLAVGTQVKLPLQTPGSVMVVLSIPMLLYGGGFLGVLEILGTLGNVLSYARIMALGLVSVMLAKLANDAGAGLSHNIVLAILVAALIHAVNLLIHVFTPSIHALRLNFVEFFGKFYEFGGREYKPFRRGGVG